MVVKRTCSFRKEDGHPCSVAPLQGSNFCLMHDPEHAQEVAEARRLGGLRRRKEGTVAGAYEFNGLGTVADIRRVLEIAVLDTLSLENSIARSRTLAYIAQVALRALEVGELEDRVRALEAVVRLRPQRPVSAFDFEPDGDDGEFAQEVKM